MILDEVTALSHAHQGKILKFADEQIVPRVGDHTIRNVSTRIIATSSTSQHDISDGTTLRRDLFHRLSGHVIALPALRDRVDDIAEIALFIATEYAQDRPSFSNSAMRALIEYPWTGNIRDLRFAVRRAVKASQGGPLNLSALGFLSPSTQSAPQVDISPQTSPPTASERGWIAAALSRNGFRRKQTAEDLGMTTRTLYNKIKKYGLEV